ncbi:hypothetical protein QJS10_CPA08g01775 [Acorus calamus]|uniref:SAWADEE domain-containing protein n=1 Tax=Acorus calamus TaxID=4465 RepID=A0AAV9EAW4_ACOCL|nr:hypothetical protein QJS10_CPA08g01775 [Acorus calamus]
MPPKPHLRSPPPPVSAVECRSPFDNAWYNVSVSSAGRKGKIRIRYDGFPDCYDEHFKVSDFAGPAELNRFLDRFRPASLQLQDGWCREGLVAAGDVVCACRQSGDADVLFYDAVVDSVCYSEHQFLEGEEICTCTFVVSWQHGPNVGLKTTIRVENLCLLQHGDPTIDATLRSFVKAWKEKSDLDMERSTRLGSKKLMFEGMNCNGKQNIEQDVDLGGGFSHHKDYYYPMCDHYIILVENLEKDILPWTIRDFIYQHTSILSRVYVVPGLVWETYVRGVIFLDSEEKLEKLFCFLCNPTHLIVSSRGRPWVIRERNGVLV